MSLEIRGLELWNVLRSQAYYIMCIFRLLRTKLMQCVVLEFNFHKKNVFINTMCDFYFTWIFFLNREVIVKSKIIYMFNRYHRYFFPEYVWRCFRLLDLFRCFTFKRGELLEISEQV